MKRHFIPKLIEIKSIKSVSQNYFIENIIDKIVIPNQKKMLSDVLK